MVRTTGIPAILALAVLVMAVLMAGCTGSAAPPEEGGLPRVVASTSIVGDVVAQVGGDAIELHVLMAAGQDPHSYEPTARDIANVEQAHVIFVNGFDLEQTLLTTLRTTGASVPIIAVSEGIEPIPAGEHEEGEHGEEHEHGEFDPHVWLNPLNVVIWAENIAGALAEIDPANAETYHRNAAAYAEELRALDAEIEAAIARIPHEQRRIVSNHHALAYFAKRYDIMVVGTVYAILSGYGLTDEARCTRVQARSPSRTRATSRGWCRRLKNRTSGRSSLRLPSATNSRGWSPRRSGRRCRSTRCTPARSASRAAARIATSA